MAAPYGRTDDRNGAAPAKRSRMDAFIDRIELTAAIFIGIVTVAIIITGYLFNLIL